MACRVVVKVEARKCCLGDIYGEATLLITRYCGGSVFEFKGGWLGTNGLFGPGRELVGGCWSGTSSE